MYTYHIYISYVYMYIHGTSLIAQITLNEEAVRAHWIYSTHTATHCDTLQHTATHCNTLQHTATYCNILQHTATHCNTLQHTATAHWIYQILIERTRWSGTVPTTKAKVLIAPKASQHWKSQINWMSKKFIDKTSWTNQILWKQFWHVLQYWGCPVLLEL